CRIALGFVRESANVCGPETTIERRAEVIAPRDRDHLSLVSDGLRRLCVRRDGRREELADERGPREVRRAEDVDDPLEFRVRCVTPPRVCVVAELLRPSLGEQRMRCQRGTEVIERGNLLHHALEREHARLTSKGRLCLAMVGPRKRRREDRARRVERLMAGYA